MMILDWKRGGRIVQCKWPDLKTSRSPVQLNLSSSNPGPPHPGHRHHDRSPSSSLAGLRPQPGPPCHRHPSPSGVPSRFPLLSQNRGGPVRHRLQSCPPAPWESSRKTTWAFPLLAEPVTISLVSLRLCRWAEHLRLPQPDPASHPSQPFPSVTAAAACLPHSKSPDSSAFLIQSSWKNKLLCCAHLMSDLQVRYGLIRSEGLNVHIELASK